MVVLSGFGNPFTQGKVYRIKKKLYVLKQYLRARLNNFSSYAGIWIQIGSE